MMFVIVALACTVAVPVMAQSDATMTGNYLLGGTMSWNSVDNENATERTSTWTVAPRAMRFVADNIAVGAEIAFAGMSFGSDTGFSAQRYFALGEYVFPMNNDNFRFYAEGGGGFVRHSQNSTGGDLAFNGWGATGGVGAYFFLNDHVSINPAISYIYESMGDDGTVPMGNNQTIFLRIGVTGFLLP